MRVRYPLRIQDLKLQLIRDGTNRVETRGRFYIQFPGYRD